MDETFLMMNIFGYQSIVDINQIIKNQEIFKNNDKVDTELFVFLMINLWDMEINESWKLDQK